MIEQQLAERLRAIVDDEPPLRLDLDALVDRLLRRRRSVWWHCVGRRRGGGSDR